ncbi:MAG: hypothetical protein HY378_01420 [Candidatus Brennerbacteria bacterium]|nr:hypothetical protein [Candidatus Brennerbacteria bacterium]
MKVFGVILVIIIVLGALYAFVTWVAGKVDFAGVFSRPGAATSTGEPRASVRKDDGRATAEFEKPSGLELIDEKDIPDGFTRVELSPDFGKVEVTSVKRPSSLGKGGGFTLRANSTLKENLDVTNWRIKSNRGEIAIKGGVADVPPVNLKKIVLRPRTSAVFYADVISFVQNVELNKCTGYLNNTYALSPKLPNNCPRPERSEYISFSGECQNFIRSLSSCEQPTSNELNRFASPNNVPCRRFLESLNYGNCFNKYSGDANFYSYGFRVWMRERLPFDPKHDRLLLFDENGLLVDEHIY